MTGGLDEEIAGLVGARRGHFRLESGHHGELWLDLELLCLRPHRVELFTSELARRLEAHAIEAVCGPLIEGAFVALRVAAHLEVDFSYAVREATRAGGIHPFDYRIPEVVRPRLEGRRVAIVNDVINAGSAVLGTYRALMECGALPVAVGALLSLGEWAPTWASQAGLALESVARWPNSIWTPAECPLCAAGVPLGGIRAVTSPPT